MLCLLIGSASSLPTSSLRIDDQEGGSGPVRRGLNSKRRSLMSVIADQEAGRLPSRPQLLPSKRVSDAMLDQDAGIVPPSLGLL